LNQRLYFKPTYTSDLSYFSVKWDGVSGFVDAQVSDFPTNAAPAITEGVSQAVTLSEDGNPTGFSLSLNATDTDADTLTWSIDTAASKGTALVSGTGLSKAISYTPTANANGSDSFVVKVSDGNGGEDTITVNLTIESVNDPLLGSVVIVGAAEENNTLSVNNTLSDADVLGAAAFEWKRGTAVVGTSTTYQLDDADVGQIITVTLTFTDGGGTVESKTSPATDVVVNVNDTPLGRVVITGTALEDQTLVADAESSDNTVVDADGLGVFSYQWHRNGVIISGATNQTYSLGDSDVSALMTVTVSYTDGYGTLESLTSAATASVGNINDAPTGSVIITGTATENQTLTANNSLADDDGLGVFSYQWYQNGTIITGSTNNTYQLGNSDVGQSITVSISYTDGHGTLESATSSATAMVNGANEPLTGNVTITGSAIEDQTLTGVTSTLADADGLGVFSYQWYQNGIIITGSTKNTYQLGDNDVGKFISLTVSYTDGNGTLESATSSATAIVANVNDAPTGMVTITGIALEDHTLKAMTTTLADADGLGVLSYQWQRNGSNINGATSIQHVTVSDDIDNTLTLTVSYTDLQGTPESLTSTEFGPIKGDLDKDGIADDADADIDGDGMTNEFEKTHGLDPRDSSDASTDLDGDGVSNLDEFIQDTDPSTDDIAPVFSLLPTVTFDATGLFTDPAISAITAFDGKDGAVDATRTTVQYKPGVHSILWTAIDAAGNKATSEQVLHINPLVNVEIDQQAEEGSTIAVRVVLNGDAPIYPVTVNYTVTGTADETDHDASSDTLNITNGLEGSILFNLLNDSLNGEAGETVIFTLGDMEHGVAGHNIVHTVTVIETNAAPSATLSVTQADKPRLLIEQTAGVVVVSASVTDPNPNDTHQYDWSHSANSLIDTDESNSTFTFDPTNLVPGVYMLSVKISDNGSPALYVDVDIAVNILAEPVVLTGGADSDGDGVDDTVEGAGDADGDRIPDHLDAIKLSNVLQAKVSTHDAFLMETNPGLSLRLGVTAFNAGIHIASLDETGFADNADANTSDEAYKHHSQIFDFEVSGLANNGATIDVVLPLNQALPSDAIYRKFDAQTGWYDFVENSQNTLKSAPGLEGFCPSIGDNSYTEGLNAGYYCLLVSIEDGGPNDADGAADGTVIDPGVVAVAIPSLVRTSGGAVGWPLLLLLTLIFMASLYTKKSINTVKEV